MQFKPLPNSFHSTLRRHLTVPFRCVDCKLPRCSCSGAQRARVIFLPGEREWIERNDLQRRKFKGDSTTEFPVCGDCTFLENYKCTLSVAKPFDCASFPISPILKNGKLELAFAKNCYFTPDQVDPTWVREIWEGWQYIELMVDPKWLEYYCEVPAHE